jgi:hypothetical protein
MRNNEKFKDFQFSGKLLFCIMATFLGQKVRISKHPAKLDFYEHTQFLP